MIVAGPDPDLDVEEEGPASNNTQRGLSADEARAILKARLEEIIKQVLADQQQGAAPANPDFAELCFAIRSTTGTGKSELLRQAIATEFIAEAKRLGLKHRVLILVPTHKLADEANSRMPEGITTAIWQGRNSIKLGTADQMMCLDLPRVNASLAIGAPVEETACRKAKRGQIPVLCPHYPCPYQQQKTLAHNADLVIGAHEIGFQIPPALGQFGLVIIDEGFWQKGLSGLAPTKSRLNIATLAAELKDAPVRDEFDLVDVPGTVILRELTEQLQAALAQMPDGYVQRAPLVDAGFEPEDADRSNSGKIARDLEWKRKIDPKLKPNSTDEFRAKLVAKHTFMGRLPTRVEMWRAIEELIGCSKRATGRLWLETDKTDPQGEHRYIRVLSRKELAKRVRSLPIVYADATAPVELVKNYLPKLQLACDLNVEAPHMKVTQVIGMPVGKTSLEPKKPGVRKGKQTGAWTETPEEVEARVARKRQRLAAAVTHLVRGRRGLVITYESIEFEFKSIAGVETAHFGNFTGIDRWKDVEVLVIIGRPLPARRDIENMAAAVTGKPVIAGAPMVQECTIESGPLAGRVIKRRLYGDLDAEAVKQAITEAALIQAIGRVRAVNRTVANPVEVFLILDDTVVPGLPIDEWIAIDDIEPDAIDLMFAEGWEPQLPSDAAKLFPKLFTREAAKKAYQRDRLRSGSGLQGPRLGTWSYEYGYVRRCLQPHRIAICFQPAGRGQVRRFCMVDPVKVPDPRAALEAAFKKPLVHYEVIEPEPIAAE